MSKQAYPLRISEEIVDLARLRSREEYVDQSTALRQLLHLGAEEYVLSLVEQGRISAGRAAEMLKLSPLDIYRLAEKHGVRLGSTVEQRQKSMETGRKIFRKR